LEEAHAFLLSSYLAPTPLPLQKHSGEGEGRSGAKKDNRKKHGPVLLCSIPFFPAGHEMWVVAYRDFMANKQ
jgi:hypothetical protein